MNTDLKTLKAAAARYQSASNPVTLTGAGISVECGIPDFRSPGGIWSQFPPEEYGTLSVFLSDPAKAWELYRALEQTIVSKKPGPAHLALAELESRGKLAGVITQNIDCLHTVAGSQNVLEVHGEYQHLHCLTCGDLRPIRPSDREEEIPTCQKCDFPLKPNVVLFEEWVRKMDKVEELVEDSDLMLVIGTSAQVFPIAELPHRILARGGTVIEFNVERTRLTPSAEFSIQGKAGHTVPLFTREVLGS
jgi:NAD-dependent deacetylase